MLSQQPHTCSRTTCHGTRGRPDLSNVVGEAPVCTPLTPRTRPTVENTHFVGSTCLAARPNRERLPARGMPIPAQGLALAPLRGTAPVRPAGDANSYDVALGSAADS